MQNEEDSLISRYFIKTIHFVYTSRSRLCKTVLTSQTMNAVHRVQLTCLYYVKKNVLKSSMFCASVGQQANDTWPGGKNAIYIFFS